MRRSLKATRNLASRTYIELGVRRAETSRWLHDTLAKCRDEFAQFGVDFSEFAAGQWKKKMRKLAKGCPAQFLAMTTKAAAELDWHEPMAWVFIDACHCFECATDDILTWGAKLAPGGHLLVHDTTDKRRHYTALFQHYEPDVKKSGTRTFGVWEAVQEGQPAGDYLRREFTLVEEVDSDNGLQVWRKN